MSAARIFLVRLDSGLRSGRLARAASVFAQRGISLDEALAAELPGGPALVLKAQVSEALASALAARLRRCAGVREVEVHPGEGRRVWELARPEPRLSPGGGGFGG